MTRLLALGALGLAATAGLLATPQTSNAQSPFGVQLNFGKGRGISYYQGTPSDYYGNGYQGNGYYGNGYGGYRQQFVAPGYNCDYGYRAQPPVIVHPEYSHWTPNRGYHSHGHMHVPTPWGYRVRPY